MYHYQHNVMGEQLTGKMVASADVLDAAVRHLVFSLGPGEDLCALHLAENISNVIY